MLARLKNSPSFASFAIPEYRTLWWGSLFSYMAVQMQFMLRGLLAWDLTESEASLGLVYMAFGAALLVSTPLGGVASDRLRKRSLMLAGQAMLTVTAVGMGVAVLTDIVEFWMLLVAGVIQGAMFGLTGPARVAMSAELVGKDKLGNAISLSMLAMNGSRVLAPSFAAALAGIALFGIGGAYLVTGIASLASFAMMAKVPNPDPISTSTKSPWGDIVDGVRYVRSEPKLARLMIAMFGVVMIGFNYVSFTPALVEGVFERGDTWVGLMSTASSLGAVAISFHVARVADSARAPQWLVGGGLTFGFTVMLLGLAPSLWVALAVSFVIGMGNTTFQVLSGAQALGHAVESHRGRVQSLMQLSFAGFGLASWPLGRWAESIGLQRAITIMGAVTMSIVVLYWLADSAAERRSRSGHVGDPSDVSGALGNPTAAVQPDMPLPVPVPDAPAR